MSITVHFKYSKEISFSYKIYPEKNVAFIKKYDYCNFPSGEKGMASYASKYSLSTGEILADYFSGENINNLSDENAEIFLNSSYYYERCKKRFDKVIAHYRKYKGTYKKQLLLHKYRKSPSNILLWGGVWEERENRPHEFFECYEYLFPKDFNVNTDLDSSYYVVANDTQRSLAEAFENKLYEYTKQIENKQIDLSLIDELNELNYQLHKSFSSSLKRFPPTFEEYMQKKIYDHKRYSPPKEYTPEEKMMQAIFKGHFVEDWEFYVDIYQNFHPKKGY